MNDTFSFDVKTVSNNSSLEWRTREKNQYSKYEPTFYDNTIMRLLTMTSFPK